MSFWDKFRIFKVDEPDPDTSKSPTYLTNERARTPAELYRPTPLQRALELDALRQRRQRQVELAELAAGRNEVPADRLADLADWFLILLETGHTLEEAIAGVRFYARGTYGSME